MRDRTESRPARIWVTRDEPEDGDLCTALRAVGLEAVWRPVIMRRLCADATEHLERLGPRDWLVLASRFAIESIPAAAVGSRVAVVGSASADAARAKGWRVERQSPDGTGKGLWDSLRKDPAGARRLCYPRSSLAPAPAPIAGVEIAAPVLYETVPRPFDHSVAQHVDVVTVASPSAADVIAKVKGLPRAAALGPTTASALRRLGIQPWIESREATFAGFARAIAESLKVKSG